MESRKLQNDVLDPLYEFMLKHKVEVDLKMYGELDFMKSIEDGNYFKSSIRKT